MTKMRIGPFELDSPIAAGGMGEVWLGRHKTLQRKVAIKVLTGRLSQRPRFKTTFRNEARSMSTLQHPHIISIFDFGEMKSLDTASETFGQGIPYIVMDFQPYTLVTGNPVRGWRSLRRLLLELLDALAHAHARGVIHRDLKPGNILIDADGLSHVTDFGIAFGTEETGLNVESMRAAGTPEYMAPEQCHGMWRDFGPWTDLYALGCIAFELCTGTTPFQGPNQMSIMLTKLKGKIPEFLPRFAVPPGFHAWLESLLARNPEARFQRAADAAWALQGLSSDFEGAMDEIDSESDPQLEPDTIISPKTKGDAAHSLGKLHKGQAHLEILPSYEGIAVSTITNGRPPFPIDWRKSSARNQSTPLSDTGLELYTMRQPSFIGRKKLRDRLWQTLREVHLAQRAQAVILSGPTGIGKTTLARWLSETAHEFGISTYLYAFHGEQEIPGHGLPAMLMRHLRCSGLTRGEIRNRVASLMRFLPNETQAADALTELISPSDLNPRDQGDSTTVRFFSPVERHLVLADQLERMSLDRTLILWIDDVQFGFEALEFIEWYMGRKRAPILFLMTSTSEDLAKRHVETTIIESMEANNLVTLIELPPLAQHEHLRLIESSLPLEKDLVDRIASRTSGNPRFALDLIRALVDQDRLSLGEKGYALKANEVIEMPSSLAEVWDARLDEFLLTKTDQDAEALELAACLGLQVDLSEWTTLCRVADVSPSPKLSTQLVDDRLVSEFREEIRITWHFAHGMLREALLRRARRFGRLERHHTHAVNMLRVANAPPSRIGKHLLAAAQWNAALGPLERAVTEATVFGDHRAAQSALLDWTDALRLLNFPHNRRDWLKVSLAHGHIRRLQGELTESLEMSQKVIDKAQKRPHLRILAEALLLHAMIFVELARFDDALGSLRRLETIDERYLSTKKQATRAITTAQALERLGQFEDSGAQFEIAERLFMSDDDVVSASMARLGRARISRAMGNSVTALDLAESAGQTLACAGSRVGVSDALFQLGEVARMADDLDRAEHHYRKAQRGYRQIGSLKRLEAEMKLAMVLVEREAFLESQLILEQLLSTARPRENRRMTSTLHLLLAICCAQDNSWVEWSEHVQSADAILRQTPMIDFDIATYAQRAATRAYQANQLSAAQIPQAIADAQFSVLHRDFEKLQ